MPCCDPLNIASSKTDGGVYVDPVDPLSEMVDGMYTDSLDASH